MIRTDNICDVLLFSGEQWPGFDIPVVPAQESLWDTSNPNNVSPLPAPEPWQAVGSAPSPGLWDATPMSTNTSSAWNPVSSIWNTGGSTSPVANTAMAGSPDILDVSGASANEGAVGNTSPGMTGFDPFNTLGNIWRPTATDNTGSSGWGFPPRPDEEPN